MGVYRAAGDAIQALELSGGPKIVSLDPVVHETQRDDQGNESRRRDRDDDQGESRLGSIDKQLVKGPSQDFVDLVDVTSAQVSIGLNRVLYGHAYLEKRLRILPVGVVSKNDMGDLKMALAIRSWSLRDAYPYYGQYCHLLSLSSDLHIPRWSRRSREQESE